MADAPRERRLEPRYPAFGCAGFTIGNRCYQASVADVSFNGVKLERPEEFPWPAGTRFRLTLAIGGAAPFAAWVHVAHVEPEMLGLEFFDMPPGDFGVLAGVIDRFQKMCGGFDPLAGTET